MDHTSLRLSHITSSPIQESLEFLALLVPQQGPLSKPHRTSSGVLSREPSLFCNENHFLASSFLSKLKQEKERHRVSWLVLHVPAHFLASCLFKSITKWWLPHSFLLLCSAFFWDNRHSAVICIKRQLQSCNLFSLLLLNSKIEIIYEIFIPSHSIHCGLMCVWCVFARVDNLKHKNLHTQCFHPAAFQRQGLYGSFFLLLLLRHPFPINTCTILLLPKLAFSISWISHLTKEKCLLV